MCFFAAVEAGGSRNLPERGELLPPLLDFVMILTQFVGLSSKDKKLKAEKKRNLTQRIGRMD